MSGAGKMKRWCLWAILLLLDALVVFAVAEAWVRLFVPVKNICYETDATIGVRFCPNQHTVGYVEKGYANILETNSLGFHDRERQLEKNPGTFRIQFYGDSFVQGYGVKTEETISSQVETALNALGSQWKFEVMNMAPGDDGTSAQVLTYEQIGRKFKPDLVVCYFMDDFPDNVMKIHGRAYSAYHRLDIYGRLVYIRPVPKDFSSPWERFKANSRLYRLAANKVLESKFYNELQQLKNGVAHAAGRVVGASPSESKGSYAEERQRICVTESWPVTLRLIQHFRDEVEKDGGHFVLVDGEPFYDVNVGTVYSNGDFEDFCLRDNISYIPAYKKYSELRSLPDAEKYFFKDHHMKPVGNREMSLVLAEQIRAVLAENGLIRQPPGP